MNWGCTFRVGQMLVCNTLMRHLIIDSKNFCYRSSEQYEDFQMYEKLSVKAIKKDPVKYEIYLQILSQIFDNQLPGDHLHAFNMNSMSKMALVS